MHFKFTYDKQGSEVQATVIANGRVEGNFTIDESHREKNVYGIIVSDTEIGLAGQWQAIVRTRGEFEEWVKPLIIKRIVSLKGNPNHKHVWTITGQNPAQLVKGQTGDLRDLTVTFRCKCLQLRNVSAQFDLNTGKDW